MDLNGFNAQEVAPNEGFSAIPAGDYQVIITESQEKQTKAGDGSYLELRLQVLNGPHQNRVLFDRLNLKNRNPTAVQIAQGTLSAICRAVNVLTPKDSSELHSKPLTAVVKVSKDNNGNFQNEVKGYKPREPQDSSAATQMNDVEQAFAESASAPAERKSPF